MKFSSLVSKLSNKLQEKHADISQVRFSITSAFYVQKQDLVAELKAAQDFTSLFELVTSHGVWSYKNYHFLEEIINEYIPDLQDNMEDYQRDYAGYQFMTKLEDHIAAETGLADPDIESHDLFSRLKTTVRINPSERTLKYIEELWKSLSTLFCLPSYQLLREKILRGSVTISWCFPQCETIRLIELVKTSSQFFTNHSIVKVSINGQVFYEDNSNSLQQEVDL